MTPLRLRILTPIASFAAALAFVGCSGESTPQVPGENDPAGSNPAPLPNIVWIVSDDQSFTDFGFMGHEVVQTPRIDDLAAQSLVFRHGYNPTSLCRPGLATLITGKHQHEHGLTFNDPEPGVRRGIANQFLLRQRPAPSHWKSKQSQYDLGVRTPVLLHWPGRIAPGVSDELVSSIDLLPTSLAAAGLDIPENLPGLNLLPRALHGEPLARDAVFGSIFRHTAKDWDRPDANVLFRWIRAGDWKLILPEIENEPLELYHLAEDPLENVNLAQHPEQVERIRTLRARLDAWWSPGPETDGE